MSKRSGLLEKSNLQEFDASNLKSIWKEIERKDFHFYCAGCHKERRLFAPPKVGTLRQIFQISITTAFFTLLFWPWLEWKGVVSFVPIWAVYEVFFRMKMRAALVCAECGFDPILYLVDSKKAAAAVEQHWRKKFEERGWAYPERKVRHRLPKNIESQLGATQAVSKEVPDSKTTESP